MCQHGNPAAAAAAVPLSSRRGRRSKTRRGSSLPSLCERGTVTGWKNATGGRLKGQACMMLCRIRMVAWQDLHAPTVQGRLQVPVAVRRNAVAASKKLECRDCG